MPWSTNVAVTLQAGNTIINPSGDFVYSSAPAAGDLIASIAPSAGSDSFGNAYLQGITSYNASGQEAQLLAGEMNVYPAGLGPTGSPGNITTQGPGGVVFNAGGTSTADTDQGSVAIYSAGGNILADGLSAVILSAKEVALNETFSSTIPHAHVTGLPIPPLSSLATTIAAVNNLYAALQSCAIIAP